MKSTCKATDNSFHVRTPSCRASVSCVSNRNRSKYVNIDPPPRHSSPPSLGPTYACCFLCFTAERQFFTPERSVSIIREALGSGCSRLDIDVCSIRPWTMNALVADSYSSWVSPGKCVNKEGETGGGEGCVFLAGDAAHQFPPAGGFGLNTGVQVFYVGPLLM